MEILKTTGILTDVSKKKNWVLVDNAHIVGLEHAMQLTKLTVDELREKINQEVTIVTDKNKVIALRFEGE